MMIDLRPATDRMANLLADVTPDQFDRPTPCPDTSVGDLVDHVGALTAGFIAVAHKTVDGTEAPAAYIGVAVGACLGDRGRRWRRLLRPAALAAGASGVAALMGIAAVGTAYMLELGRRHVPGRPRSSSPAAARR